MAVKSDWESAREDKARLNWLQAYEAKVYREDAGDWVVTWYEVDDGTVAGATLRDAIDEAMKCGHFPPPEWARKNVARSD